MALRLLPRLLATRARLLDGSLRKPTGFVGGARSNSTELSVTTALLPAAPKPAVKPQAITKIPTGLMIPLIALIVYGPGYSMTIAIPYLRPKKEDSE